MNGTMKLEAQAFANQVSSTCDSLNRQLDGPDSYELAATGPTFLNVAMKETILHEADHSSRCGIRVNESRPDVLNSSLSVTYTRLYK